jgi:hypothetical protein
VRTSRPLALLSIFEYAASHTRGSLIPGLATRCCLHEFSDPSLVQIGSCERRLRGSLCTKLWQALPSKGS